MIELLCGVYFLVGIGLSFSEAFDSRRLWNFIAILLWPIAVPARLLGVFAKPTERAA